jgi:hypothetical protein
MTEVEKFLAFKITPPFDRLRDVELALIASTAVARRFEPGEVIQADTAPFGRFLLLAAGSWQSPAGPLPRSLGVGSLLFDRGAPGAILAGANGAVCLVIGKSHFHTIAYECPDLILGYLATAADDGNPAP